MLHSVSLMLLFQFLLLPWWSPVRSSSCVLLDASWQGFVESFIEPDGRVVRPRFRNDTVSEGQAYAMLHAVAMNDREVFDRVFSWTERHLSRRLAEGDNLLAWHLIDGKVADVASASDADLDYALALFFAYRQWGAEGYRVQAEAVMQDILDYETRRIGGRLYLLPWSAGEFPCEGFVMQNPSYYSPAHFRIFYQHSGDRRWLELLDTSYYLVETLQQTFCSDGGHGLVPDWCGVDAEGHLHTVDGWSSDFSWDALRVPLRFGMDYAVSGDPRALGVLKGFGDFFDSELARHKKLASGYCCYGTAITAEENPLFYAAAYVALDASGHASARVVLERLRGMMKRGNGKVYYINSKEYYPNALCWIAEYWRLVRGAR